MKKIKHRAIIVLVASFVCSSWYLTNYHNRDQVSSDISALVIKTQNSNQKVPSGESQIDALKKDIRSIQGLVSQLRKETELLRVDSDKNSEKLRLHEASQYGTYGTGNKQPKSQKSYLDSTVKSVFTQPKKKSEQYQSEQPLRSMRKGLIEDKWFDLCFRRTAHEKLWHPLIPKHPWSTNLVLKTEDDERNYGNLLRRIYGFFYLSTNEGSYDLRLLSRDGADVVIKDTGLDINQKHELLMPYDVLSWLTVIRIRLTAIKMDYQDQRIKLEELFSVEHQNVTLLKNRIYFLEIMQGGKHFARYSLQWKGQNGMTFNPLTEKNLFHPEGMSGHNTVSALKYEYFPGPKYAFDTNELRRVEFYKYRQLELKESVINSLNYSCGKIEKDYKVIKKMYQGYEEFVDNILTFPKEFFNLKSPGPGNVLKENEAMSILNQLMVQLPDVVNSEVKLANLVHIQTNYDKFDKYTNINKIFYFIEVDVKVRENGSENLHRLSQFVKPLPSGDICFMTDWKWKPGVEINLLTPIRNQKTWFLYMIQMLKDLCQQVQEDNIRIVLVDFGSTDGNYEQILKDSKFRYIYLNPLRDENCPNKFNKVKALNYGIKHIKDKDSIIFILDLHLQLPLNIFDRIRKLTIQGRTAFNPSLIKFTCGEHEQYTNILTSQWLDLGTGMMAMYKSDWDIVGGYDEKRFGETWGGEDWALMDEIFSNGLYIIHQRMQRFYHIFHSRTGMWNFKQG